MKKAVAIELCGVRSMVVLCFWVWEDRTWQAWRYPQTRFLHLNFDHALSLVRPSLLSPSSYPFRSSPPSPFRAPIVTNMILAMIDKLVTVQACMFPVFPSSRMVRPTSPDLLSCSKLAVASTFTSRLAQYRCAGCSSSFRVLFNSDKFNAMRRNLISFSQVSRSFRPS